MGKRKIQEVKNGQEGPEEEAAEEDDVVDLADWESVASSDEEKSKPPKAKGKAKAKAKGQAKKTAKPKVDSEKKEEAKKRNNELLGHARKGLRLMEPALKEGKKAQKLLSCTEDLKKETEALGSIVQECKGIVKNHTKMTNQGKQLPEIPMEFEEMKELAKMVKQKAEAVLSFQKAVNGMGDEALKKIAEAASRRHGDVD